MNIVYAMTRNVYHKAGPSMLSLVEHNPKATIYVLAEDDEVDFPVKCKIINVTDQEWFPESGPNYHNRFTYINLLKVCYPEILKVNKVIHLDIDTIICDSLDGLWKTDMAGKWYAAVNEETGSYKPFGSRYYNMGVALLNLAQMRKDQCVEGMVEYLNTVEQPWADQDAWNIHQDKAVEVDLRWNENQMTGWTNDPAVVHYCGRPDWWETNAMFRIDYLNQYRG